MTTAVLLPFKGRIIYDGLLSPFRVTFGPGIRQRLGEAYKDAKQSHGIIATLSVEERPSSQGGLATPE